MRRYGSWNIAYETNSLVMAWILRLLGHPLR